MENIISKPWGSEIIWAHTEYYVGKILNINAGEELSLQYHQVKDETILVLSGRMKFYWHPETEPVPIIKVLLPGDSFHIPSKLIHKMEAIDDVCVLEVSTPQLEDVIRLSDKYGRV